MHGLLLHGWGIENTVWQKAQNSFSAFESLSSPCLYEIARKTEIINFESIASSLLSSIDKETVILAWSIGGLMAIPLQRLTGKVKAIIFIASTPCFVNKTYWLNVLDKKNILGLQTSLESNTKKTLNYFSGLIAHGDTKEKETNKIIRQHQTNETNREILSLWLDEMIITDHRRNFSEISCPVLMVLGEKDSLIHSKIEKELISLNNNIDTRIIKDCGHAPFISKHEETAKIIKEFINAKLS